MKRFNVVWISLVVLLLVACSGEGVSFTIDDFEDTEVTEVSSESSEKKGSGNSSENPEEDDLAEFKKATGIYLDAKSVQYDMENNLDKEFYLTGQLRLCDYYNYGYTNQSKIYCAEMHPDDGSDYWYLYFSREKTRTLYNELLQGNVNLKLTAMIHKEVYRQGQGNMAAAMQIPLNYITNNSQ